MGMTKQGVPRPIPFFALLLRPSVGIVSAGLAVVAVAVSLALTSSADFDQAYGLVLLLQMFAAATGFTQPARRGHYDPVLVFPRPRTSTAVVHATVSAAPGIVVWLAVLIVDVAFRRPSAPTGASPSAIAAIAWTSAVVWVATMPLPRYSGALLWIGLTVVLAVRRELQPLEPLFLAAGTTWLATLKAAAAALAAPLLLVAHPTPADASTIAIVIGASLAAVATGVWFVQALDVDLVDLS